MGGFGIVDNILAADALAMGRASSNEGSRSEIRTFEDLECWKAAREVRLFVAKDILPVLPKDERYRLGDQILRASRSITANIAEGYGRFHYLDNSKFCSNARGSAFEVLDHLITGADENLLTTSLVERGRVLIGSSIRLINGYMAYLKRAGGKTTTAKDGESET
jgi:four helix bundle protein